MTYIMVFSDLDPTDATGVVPIFLTIQSPSKELWDTETSVSVSAIPVLLQRPIGKLGGGTNVSRVAHVFWHIACVFQYGNMFLLWILLNSSKNVYQERVLPSFISKDLPKTNHSLSVFSL